MLGGQERQLKGEDMSFETRTRDSQHVCAKALYFSSVWKSP